MPRIVVTENPTTGGNSQEMAVQRQSSVVISYSHTLYLLCCKPSIQTHYNASFYTVTTLSDQYCSSLPNFMWTHTWLVCIVA